MKRWLPIFLVSLSLCLLVSHRAEGAATGCSYPVTLDTFSNVSTGQILTAADYNRLLCLVEALETKLTLPRYTVATLPGSPVVGQQAIVTDALDGSTCVTGGGSSENECTYKSGGWVVSSGGGGGGAPTAATYITRTSDGTLSNEFALSSLTNGILKHTGGTPATAVAGTDYLSPSGSGAALTSLNASNLGSGNVPIARNTISVLDGTASYCLGTSGTDTYSCVLPSAPGSYVTGGTYRFKADVANTGAASINFNSLGAKTIKKWVAGSKVDLVTGDISANQVVVFMYDGTDMVAVSFGGGGGGGSFTYITEDGTGPLITGAIRYGTTGTNDLTDDYTAITGHKTRTKKNVDGDEAVTTGTLTNGNCAKFDSSGRIVDHGSACGGGGATDISVKAYHNTTQNINDSTDTTVSLNSEIYDTDSMHSTVTNTSRLTFNTAGKYRLTGQVSFASAGDTSHRYVEILLNGSTIIASSTTQGVSGAQAHFTVTTDWLMSASDYVEMRVFQNSGGSVNLNNNGTYSPSLSAAKIF